MEKYISGLDLGQSQDHSALVCVEQTEAFDELGRSVRRHDVRHIHRWPLSTPYPRIVEDLGDWFRGHPLRGSQLIVDATGVGRGVVDLITATGLTASVKPYTITCGFTPSETTVPKKDLVGAVMATLQTRRLRFAEELDLRPVLEKELEMFRVKVTSDRNETFGSWRERDHDDLVLALAMAVWYGERNRGSGYEYPTEEVYAHGDLPASTFD